MYSRWTRGRVSVIRSRKKEALVRTNTETKDLCNETTELTYAGDVGLYAGDVGLRGNRKETEVSTAVEH